MRNRILAGPPPLLLAGPTPAIPLRIRAEGDEAHVYLYDAIGGWYGILAADVVKELAAITAPTIHLHINSPGGDVFEARAIATAVRGHKSKVIAHVDGLAASAATYIATSAAEVEIAKGAFFMIHRAWCMTWGNAVELRTQADLLEKIDGTIADDYTAKTGKDRKQIDEWMDAETWFTADEAVEHGFCDRLAGDGGEAPAEPEDRWNLAAFRNPPKALLERKPKAAAVKPDHGDEDRRRRVAMLEAIG